jgi:DNA-directed RNA polymerase subunit beta'
VIFNNIFPDDFPYINDKPTEDMKVIGSVVRRLRRSPELGQGKKAQRRRGCLAAYIASLPLKNPIKKKDLGTIIDMVFHHYGTTKTSAVLDKIKDQGFKYSTVSSVTIAISDIVPVDGKYEEVEKGQVKVDKINALYRKGMLSDKERHTQVVKIWSQVTDDVKKRVAERLSDDKRNPIVIMADSGARGNLDNFKQLIGMKGLVANPKNEEIELPIVSSYREGMKVSEFFINTHGARKGGADTALKTADSGYLTRRLVDVSQDVIVREEDCHCDHGFKVRAIRDTSRDTEIVSLYSRLVGRFSMHDILDPKTVVLF